MPPGEAEISAAASEASLLGAWVVTAAALLIVVAGRRRLPLGVGEGLFGGAVSVLLLLNYTALDMTGGHGFGFGESLVALAVWWLIIALWIERGTAPSTDPNALERRTARRMLAAHAAAIAGLLALPLLTSVPVTGPLTRIVPLLALLIVALGFQVQRQTAVTRYALLAIIGVFLRALVPVSAEASRDTLATLILPLAGAGTLIVVLGALLGDWRRRVRLWQTDPHRLIEPGPTHFRLYTLAVLAGLLVGLAALSHISAPLTPLAVGCAALAVHTVGHCWRSDFVGEIGMALTAEWAYTVVLAWLPDSPAAPQLGVVLAGLWLLWLARFWQQQLCTGRPWTTAGRLIHIARHMSLAAAGGQILFAAAWMLAGRGAESGGTLAVVTVVAMLAYWSLLMRDAHERRCSATAAAACLVLVAALVPAWHVIAAWIGAASPTLMLGLAAVALALRAAGGRGVPAVSWVCGAYLGGILPLAAAYAVTLPGDWPAGKIGGAIGLAAILAAVLWHWGLCRADTRPAVALDLSADTSA